MLQFPTWEITVLINHSFVSTNMSSKHYIIITKMKYGKLLRLPRLTICIVRHNPPPWIALAR